MANQKTETKRQDDNKSTTKTTVKKKLKLDDDVLISVRSNVFGTLTYINHKTGDETNWDNYGDIQSLSVGDLRAMKAKQLSFFKENWIMLIEIEDVGYEDVEVTEIYDTLQISQYYKDILSPDDINAIFNQSVSKIKSKIINMPKSIQQAFVIRANELIKNGSLDSISKIKAIEETLNCELTSPDED